MKAEEAEDAKSSVGWVYHLFCQCGQAVPEKKLKLLQMWQSWPSCERLPKGSQQDHSKSEFKYERGDDKEGRTDPSETSSHSTSIPRWGSESLKTSQKVPFLNPDPLTQWSGPKNIALVKIDGKSSWALLDCGFTIHAVTPDFIVICSLDVGPLSDLPMVPLV